MMPESDAVKQASASGQPAVRADSSGGTNCFSDDGVKADAASSPASAPSKNQSKQRPKKEISTLEELVSHAYSRKGQRVTLNKKAAHSVAEAPIQMDALLERVAALAAKDVLLAVPRQLLLLALKYRNVTTLWQGLQRVVDRALDTNPLTRSFLVQVASHPDADLVAAMEATVSQDYMQFRMPEGDKPLTKPQVTVLRMNVAYTLALWLVARRGSDVTSVVKAIYSSLWESEGDQLRTDNDRLRAVTEVRQLSNAGVLCDAFVKDANEQRDAAQAASQREALARREAESLQVEILNLKNHLQTQEMQFDELRGELDRTIAANQAKVIHLKDDFERLRTRVLRRLENDLELLNDGLHALRRNPPKLEVMEDHADRAINSLRAELRVLQEEIGA